MEVGFRGCGNFDLVAAVATWILLRRTAPEDFALTQLTYDSGSTTEPAISPDGKLVAYTSDRNGEGNRDIWVQNIATGDRERLASDPADDNEPSFSPDGSKVVFHSDRDGGGIYTVAVLGGELKLIAKRGRGPRFSPDGQRIVYWVGESYFVRTQVYVVAAKGGTPRQVQPKFYGAHDAVWSSDGKYLLFWGQRNESSAPDWWVTPVDGGEPVETGVFAVFARQNLAAGGPAAWVDDQVYFSARRDTTNLWKTTISPRTGKSSGLPRRLTFGTDQEGEPSVASNGNLVFSSAAASTNVWRLPMDLKQGKVTGNLQRVTRDLSTEVFPSISANQRLAFSADRSGKREIWVKDLAHGQGHGARDQHVGVRLTEDHAGRVEGGVCGRDSGLGHPCGLVEWSGRQSLPERWPSARLFGGWNEAIVRSQVVFAVLRGTAGLDQRQDRGIDPASEAGALSGVFFSRWSMGGVPGAARGQRFEPHHLRHHVRRRACRRAGHLDPGYRWQPHGPGSEVVTGRRRAVFLIGARRIPMHLGRAAGPKDQASRRRAVPGFHFHHSQQSLTSLGSPGKVGLSVTSDGLLFSLAETTGNIWMARARK